MEKHRGNCPMKGLIKGKMNIYVLETKVILSYDKGKRKEIPPENLHYFCEAILKCLLKFNSLTIRFQLVQNIVLVFFICLFT